jgi:hypothetical protein
VEETSLEIITDNRLRTRIIKAGGGFFIRSIQFIFSGGGQMFGEKDCRMMGLAIG